MNQFRRQIAFWLALQLSLLSNSAFAPPPLDITASAFFEITNARWNALQSGTGSVADAPLQVGQTGYAPIGRMILGQDEISVDNILNKLAKRTSDSDIIWQEAEQRWNLSHDNGNAAISKDKPLLVIKGPQGYLIKDGHHDLFMSLYVGASEIPIKVVEDLSTLSVSEFWAKVKGGPNEPPRVFLKRSAESLAARRPGIDEVTDNPNRYLASLLAAKVKAKLVGDRVEVSKISGSTAPVWLKVNDSEPFIEFFIARVLSEAGIHYDRKWRKKIPPEVIEQARLALIKALEERNVPELLRVPILMSLQDAEAVSFFQANAIGLPRFLGAPACSAVGGLAEPSSQ